MSNIVFKIIQRFNLRDPNKVTRFIEQFYIKKYGSPEKAQQVFKSLKENSKDEETYIQAVHDKLLTDLHYNELKSIIRPFLKAKNIYHLAKNLLSLKANKSSIQGMGNIKTIESDYKNFMQPAFQEAFQINESTKIDIIEFINKNVSFNLANTRKELKCSHPNVFNDWLHFFLMANTITKLLKTTLITPES